MRLASRAVLLLALGLPAGPASRALAAAPPDPPAPAAVLPNAVEEVAAAKARAALGTMPLAAAPTPNQQAWDVTAYDLDLAPSTATRMLWASARTRATVVSGPLLTLELDLDDTLRVDSVRVAGAPAPFTHALGLLTVTLGRAYLTGESVDLTVWYHGRPVSGAFGVAAFTDTTHNGAPLVWTLSEPYGARAWWPCKDHPEDKADSVSVRVTVPSGMTTVSNGRRVEASDDGTVAVTRWVERHPIATYLVSIASYAYVTSTDWYRPSPVDSMPIQFYFFPDTFPGTAAVSAEVKGMIAAYAARFGPYPFLDEKYGEAQFTWGGGMENQTITSLGNPASEYVAAHELTHMWWGDMVTCRDFHHIWLNEGFASYGPALWAEAQSGLSGYHAFMATSRYLGSGTIYVPADDDPIRIFNSSLTYNKASWVLHMLRHVLGDTVFFQALRAYGAEHRYGTATTEDFRDVCAAVSGRNLDAFFQEWIYGEYYPVYGASWVAAPAGGGWDVRVTLVQRQSWQLFWMPVDVAISTTGGSHTFVALDSLGAQTFTFHVAQPPTSVQIDPDEWILRTISNSGVEPAAAGGPELFPPRPNPARGATSFAFVLPRSGEVRLDVYDLRGAKVRSLVSGTLEAGAHVLPWDGRDAQGRSAPPGIYAVRLQSAGQSRSQRLVLVR